MREGELLCAIQNGRGVSKCGEKQGENKERTLTSAHI